MFDLDPRRARAAELGLYDPADEHDACGVGLVAAIDGAPRREIVEMAIRALKAVWHRGAVDADGKTGDGAGIRLNVPQDLVRRFVARTGHEPKNADVCVGMIFLPRTDFGAQDAARSLVEQEIIRFGFYIYGWRQVPVRADALGVKANATRPDIEQVLFHDPQGRSVEELDRVLYIVRKRIENRARAISLPSFYICSLSARDVIYKGMFLAEEIDAFFPDLTHKDFVSSVAIFHQRYSTNTFPEWRLAQPFRMLAHNGEINTLKGNTNWMKSHERRMTADAFGEHGEDLRPVIQPGSSDSAALDQVFEILVRAGRSAPMAKTLLIPEAWSKREAVLPANWRAMYEYNNSVMEPWDGPAAIAAYDGRWAIAGLDRNGLRPLRYAITEDGVLTVGSETGMCPLDGKTVARRGAVEPGRMIGVDLQEGRFYDATDLLNRLADSHSYEKWTADIREIDEEIGPGPEDRLFDAEDLRRRQSAAGFSLETVDLILRPMSETGKEAIGSMGDDTALAVLSESYRPLSHYFRQNFSQVTNPPIDPLREARVMSLKTRFKNLGDILADVERQTGVFVLDSPVLTNGMYERMVKLFGDGHAYIDCTFNVSEAKGDGSGLAKALKRIRREAADAVRGGADHIVLSDLAQSDARAPVPMILAVGGVHAHLTAEGLRTHCSLTVRSAECTDAHYLAVLIGVGATAVNPYLAFESIAERAEKDGAPVGKAAFNTKLAFEAGLMKILSKMGIAVISAYRGGCNFEALGLSRTLVAEFFPGMTSRISGIGLAGLEANLRDLHTEAWRPGLVSLGVGGFYRQRASGERHAVEARTVAALQKAVREDDYASYKEYVFMVHDRPPLELRDLVAMRKAGPERPLAEVESINTLRKRFVTPGMSLGALSPEAHGALNIAMNRIGAKSVSGEGGEVPERYHPMPNGDNANSAVKQVASGRFGVTATYLNQCREIEIKVAQGAKPGEGGQLPGFKVTEFIGRMRHATPGVTLISPPPHHDIYSIEDLAQLIYDLKQINPEARVCVKLVSAAGVGTIAAGVAKAKADVILISGNVGGTGASPQTSIKFAGSPWELGLAEAHQILTLNNLREQVTLRTDGGIRTGRDVVIAAMLGAEEFGVGTASLIALGCLMVRQCHSNTCPVGVCTQDEDLRRRLPGTADHVVSLMTFLAEEVREILASLGARTLDEVIGRSDLLDQVSRGSSRLDDLDLNPVLTRVDAGETPKRSDRTRRNEVTDTLDAQILADAAPVFERREKMQLTYDVANTHRAVGARVSSKIVRTFTDAPLEDGHLTVKLRGSAGQSLGAFSAKGLRLEVVGDANDYVGKGLSGAVITVVRNGGERGDAIIGNTCLYGATSGALFAAGRAGQRFAVRNSGADAVIEGCSANGCEYMTGGRIVILGSVGDNFAAGMTGGRAFIYDPEGRLPLVLNPGDVEAFKLVETRDADVCRELIERHCAETKSELAASILSDWDVAKADFVCIVPKEILRLEAEATSAKSA